VKPAWWQDDIVEPVAGLVEDPFVLRELAQVDRPVAGCEWIRRSHDHDELLPSEPDQGTRPGNRPRANGDVREPLQHGVVEAIAVLELAQPDAYPRMSAAKGADQLGKHAHGKRSDRGDLQLPALERLGVADREPTPLGRRQHCPRLREELTPRRCEPHPAGGPLE
jgi:hypothetical protein